MTDANSQTAVEVPLEWVAHLLGLPPEAAQAAMRAGTLTSVLEKGVGRDAGRMRLTFFHGTRRARIILELGNGATIGRVAELVGCSRTTVSKWRARFTADRIDGLEDAPRSGRPRALTDEAVQALVDRTLHSKPANGDRAWSVPGLAPGSAPSAATSRCGSARVPSAPFRGPCWPSAA